MNNSDMRFALTLSLLTAGLGLMLVGMSWLTFLGLALVVFSDSYMSRRQPKPMALWVCLAGVVLGLMRGSRAFSRTPPEWWDATVLVGVWLWGVFSEFRRWREERKHNQ